MAFSQAYICNRINNNDSVGSRKGSCQLYAAFLHSRILDMSSPYFTHSFATPLRVADGAIVGSALKFGGKAENEVSLDAARAFMTSARSHPMSAI